MPEWVLQSALSLKPRSMSLIVIFRPIGVIAMLVL
jgi:hypothetical protein